MVYSIANLTHRLFVTNMNFLSAKPKTLVAFVTVLVIIEFVVIQVILFGFLTESQSAFLYGRPFVNLTLETCDIV